MNEGFRIRLRRSGKTWPIDSLTDLEVVGGTINVDIDEDEPDALVIVDVRPDSRTSV